LFFFSLLGETVVQSNSKSKLVSKATITADSALLFRKDLVHKSVQLQAGEKHILTLV
jgi:hypothetical protein